MDRLSLGIRPPVSTVFSCHRASDIWEAVSGKFLRRYILRGEPWMFRVSMSSVPISPSVGAVAEGGGRGPGGWRRGLAEHPGKARPQ